MIAVILVCLAGSASPGRELPGASHVLHRLSSVCVVRFPSSEPAVVHGAPIVHVIIAVPFICLIYRLCAQETGPSWPVAERKLAQDAPSPTPDTSISRAIRVVEVDSITFRVIGFFVFLQFAELSIYLQLFQPVEGADFLQVRVQRAAENGVGIFVGEQRRGLGVRVAVRRLIDRLFQLVDSGNQKYSRQPGSGQGSTLSHARIATSSEWETLQFLEVTVGDVVVAPFGHRIELNAVGKLHLFVALGLPAPRIEW